MTARDTDPEELRPVLDAMDRLEGIVEENDRTIKGAISALRTTMLQHYHAVQGRLDAHARRLDAHERAIRAVRCDAATAVLDAAALDAAE